MGGSFDTFCFDFGFLFGLCSGIIASRGVAGIHGLKYKAGGHLAIACLPRGGFCMLTWVENVSIWGKYVSILGLFFGDMLAFLG